MSRQPWTEPQPDILGELLNSLRAVQDPSPLLPPPPPPPQLTAEESQQLLLSLLNPSDSLTIADSTASTSAAIPSQDQLNSLLSTLTQSNQSNNNNRTRDLKSLSFPESLPILQSLSTNLEFIEELQIIKNEQDEFELKLKDERNRLKIELSKKSLSSQVQLQRLKNWDRDEGLIRWKNLEESQQIRFQEVS